MKDLYSVITNVLFVLFNLFLTLYVYTVSLIPSDMKLVAFSLYLSPSITFHIEKKKGKL